MRKEVIFAIIIGALIGVVIVLGIKRLNTQSSPEEPQERVGQTQPDTPQPQQENQETNNAESIFVAISSPENKDVILNSPTQISGLTIPQAWVILSSESDEQLIQADNSGEFQFETELSGGINLYKITAIDTEGNKASTNLNIVYTTQLDEE